MSTVTLPSPKTARYALPVIPTVAGADPARSPFDGFKIAAAKLVAEAWDVDVAKVYEGVDTGKKNVDFAVAIPRFKKGNPAEWAKMVVDSFTPDNYLAEVTAQGAFLHFTMNKGSFYYHVLRTIHLSSKAARENPSSTTEAFGTNVEGKGKKLLVDFSSPNIAKPFHAGHLRSTIIGAVICNLYEANGWHVDRLNYLGDWGTQYGLLSLGFDRYGSEEELLRDPIKHLFKVYVEINKANDAEKEAIKNGLEMKEEDTIHAAAKRVFVDMENGETKAIAQWSRFRDLSIEKLKVIYKRLNVHFDVYWGESQVSTEAMERAVKILEEKNLTTIDKGALLVDLTKYKLDRAIVKKADGTSIYLTRDLAGAYEKYNKYKFDKHIIVCASQQILHFKQVFKTLELMGEESAGKIEHVTFGLVTGMSTRKGTVVFLDDILEDATEAMHDAMRANEAKINDYQFNIKRCTSFEGDFGPFIQYSHVRLCSVERKNPNVAVVDSVDDIDLSILDQPKIFDILYHLAQYPEVVKNATRYAEPSALVTWCFKLSHLVGSAWETIKVFGAEKDEAEARLFLFVQTREVLASAMRLLSLTPIERM
ncbi:arginyl-tRNA synthetase, partial [Tremellales sp. Uapishka_1]